MFIVLDKNKKFIGFSLKEEAGHINVEITDLEHKNLLEKQGNGFTFFFNKETEQLETIKLGQFEYIDDNGNVTKDAEAEQKYKNNKIIELKKERVQLKKDRKDFIEFEEDTSELDKRIEEIAKELENLENIN